jgi:hypothetical protein
MNPEVDEAFSVPGGKYVRSDNNPFYIMQEMVEDGINDDRDMQINVKHMKECFRSFRIEEDIAEQQYYPTAVKGKNYQLHNLQLLLPPLPAERTRKNTTEKCYWDQTTALQVALNYFFPSIVYIFMAKHLRIPAKQRGYFVESSNDTEDET